MDGLEASSPEPGPTVPPTSRRRIERSCILCHRRKVKCNKQLPCSNCTRTGVLCRYLPGEKQESRKSRTTISDIVNRLGQLEKTIIAVSSSDDQPGNHGGAAQAPTRPPPAPNVNHGREGAMTSSKEMLLHNSQYVNDALLSRVLEEEQEARSIVTAPNPDHQPGPHSSHSPLPFGLLGMLAQLRPPLLPSLNDLYPQKWQAMKLWQAYIQNVESQNKLLHIPTAQVTIYQAIHDPEQAPAEVKCLLFSIYFAAITTLSPSEAHALLSRDKVTSLDNFRLGLEISLSAANIFASPGIMGVQALGIFLQVIRALKPDRSVWILLGVAIRTAQSIGLHRDPSNFSVSPFEAEMRRRLWWHLVSLDARTGEDHGFTVTLCDLNTDTRLPLAVDDNALNPAMTELPLAPKNVCTEMTFRVLTFMTSRTMYQWNCLLNNPGTVPSEATRRQLFSELEAQIEAHIACCNPVIPAQRMTMTIPRLIVRRMEFNSRQQWLLLMAKNKDPEVPLSYLSNTVTDDETIAEACTIIEMSVDIQNDELLYNFRWCLEMHPQHSPLLYLLWYLCVRPEAPNATRAWAAIEAAFAIEADRLQRQEVTVVAGCSGSKWRVLEALREKAMRLRDAGRCETDEQTRVGDSVFGSGEMLPATDGAFADDSMGWDTGFVDWTSLMEDFVAKN
ncbi:hypothetical protein N431DRAFT_490081 [Stipitochalara longipes BDJ]|nr:hypothetical protein N431DRAFT_490081 [Stipitochalara longipes BDJ]